MRPLSRRGCLRCLAGLGASTGGLLLLDGCDLLSSAAPSQTRIARLGTLTDGFAEAGADAFAEFVQGLQELGSTEGKNITIERLFSEGHSEPVPELAAQLVSRPTDVIVSGQSATVLAIMHATNTTPIVMSGVVDP